MLLDVIASSRRRGFNPLSLSPALWLDANDASTLYDATTGGSLVTADGAVARWEDKSGNARHATQATSGARPLRKAAVQNGRDVVRFDGGDVLVTPSFSTAGFVSGSTILVVTNPTFTNNTIYRPLIRIEPSNTNGIQHEASNDSVVNSRSKLEAFVQNTSNTLFRATPSATTTTGWRMLASVVTTSDITLFSDGTINGGPTAITGTIKTGSSDVLRVAADVTNNFWLGDIAEILVFPTALSTTDRQAVESYLATKWGITLAT
jgi:hypothetical protein